MTEEIVDEQLAEMNIRLIKKGNAWTWEQISDVQEEYQPPKKKKKKSVNDYEQLNWQLFHPQFIAIETELKENMEREIVRLARRNDHLKKKMILKLNMAKINGSLATIDLRKELGLTNTRTEDDSSEDEQDTEQQQEEEEHLSNKLKDKQQEEEPEEEFKEEPEEKQEEEQEEEEYDEDDETDEDDIVILNDDTDDTEDDMDEDDEELPSVEIIYSDSEDERRARTPITPSKRRKNRKYK